MPKALLRNVENLPGISMHFPVLATKQRKKCQVCVEAVGPVTAKHAAAFSQQIFF